MRELLQDNGRNRRRALWLVVLVALAWRLLYWLEVHDHAYHLTPLVDAADYHTRAMQIMRGEAWSDGVYYKAPAYPFLVGLVYRLVGPSLEFVYFLQMLGGALGVGLLAWLGMRWCGLAVGLVAGLLAALYGRFVYFENQLLIVSSSLFFSVLAVAMLERSRRPWTDLVAGVCAGIALQLRPINAFFLAALLVWLALQQTRPVDRVRRMAFVLVPVLLLLIPTLRHNRLASGELVAVSVNGGINFYIGNNPDYDDTVGIRPGLGWENLTKRFGDMDDPVQWQRNFYAASFEYMRTQPLAYARLLVKKLTLFWNAREIDRNQDSSIMRSESFALRALSMPFAVFGIFGLLGLALMWRQLRTTPVHALVLLQMAGVLAFFVTSRYRLAIVPWLAVPAGVAIVECLRALDRRDARRAAALALALGVSVLLVLPDHAEVGTQSFGRPDFDMAQVLARNGDREGALRAYERAVQRHPNDADVVFRYGEHLARMGQPAAALEAYARAESLAPASYKPPLVRGAALLMGGALDEAWEAFQEAARRGDPHGRSLYNMGLVRERQGRFEEALELHRRSLARPDVAPQQLLRRLALGRTLLRLGRPEAAEVEFVAASELSPSPLLVPLERAEALLQSGAEADALRSLEALPGVESDARGQHLMSRALERLGRREAARETARRAVALEPANDIYRRQFESLESP